MVGIIYIHSYAYFWVIKFYLLEPESGKKFNYFNPAIVYIFGERLFALPATGSGMLRTTIHMNKAVYLKISLAAARLGVSRREIIIRLLTRIRHDINHFQGDFTLVKYQVRDPLNQWHCFTIIFKKHENELVSDFRRLGKLSVSCFVAKATERYLDELLQDGGIIHNYVELEHYAIGQSIVNGITCWEYYWGDPGSLPGERTLTRIHRRTGAAWSSPKVVRNKNS